MVVSPFWVGAQELWGKLDLQALAMEAGGWRQLEQCTRQDLEQLGLSPELAARWMDRDEEVTIGRALTIRDTEYPGHFRLLSDAPPVLFVEGAVEVLANPAIAVVGTRRCTASGASIAFKVSHQLATAGEVVASGLARGIDAHAHRGALHTGRTLAVLGHGLRYMSPASNRSLRAQIVARGGAIVTAFPDSIRPARWTFPVRNRWIAGLSRATIVVEAPLKSGALITAAECADLNRTVWAVEWPATHRTGAGCSALLEQGAQAMRSVHEMGVYPTPARGHPSGALGGTLCGGITLEQLARESGRPISSVLESLVALQLRGDVVRLPSGQYVYVGGANVGSAGD